MRAAAEFVRAVADYVRVVLERARDDAVVVVVDHFFEGLDLNLNYLILSVAASNEYTSNDHRL